MIIAVFIATMLIGIGIGLPIAMALLLCAVCTALAMGGGDANPTIIARTLIPTSPQGYDVAGGLYLYNRTGESVDLAAAAEAAVNITLPSDGPQILIVHTHATEAYTPDGTDVYTASDQSRTLEEEDNMLRVGDEMERVFTTTPSTTGPIPAPKPRWSSIWSSIPPSKSCWMSTGTPWWGRTAQCTRR